MASTWLDFWNGSHRIYVNDRHRAVHYARIAEDLAALVPSPGATVVDWGCGDALSADRVAARCGMLLLCDAAPATRERLSARFAGTPALAVVSPEALADGWAGRVDLVIINSVLQYLTPVELDDLLAGAKRLLRPDGRLVVADVIPPGDDLVGDVGNLLRVAATHGFFWAAVGGLAATFFSPYRRLRSHLGLARHDEAGFLARLQAAGFAARRLRPNIGFDQRRMAFEARPA